MPSLGVVALICGAAGAAMGAWAGWEFAEGQAARNQLTDVRASLAAAVTALDDAGSKLRTTALTTSRIASEQAATASRQLAEASRYEQIITRAARLECARDAESFGMLISAINYANKHLQPVTSGVPAGLRPGAAAGGSGRGFDDAVGVADGSLGGPLPNDQPAVPGREPSVTER